MEQIKEACWCHSCGTDESAAAKKKVMRECGIHVVDSPATIGAKVKEVLG